MHIINAWLTTILHSEHTCDMMPFTHWKTAENGQMSKKKVQGSRRSPLPAVIQPTAALSANNPKQDCQKQREVKMESDCSSFKNPNRLLDERGASELLYFISKMQTQQESKELSCNTVVETKQNTNRHGGMPIFTRN